MVAQPRRVLVVDDDAATRLRIARDLDGLGWDGLIVNSGREAIRVVELDLPMDVLLIAVQLPDIDGQSVARAAAQRRRDLRVCFMTSAVPVPLGWPAGTPLLVKPFSRAALAHGLTTAVSYPR